MDNNKENKSIYSKDLDAINEMPFKFRLFNFYYQTLNKKSISLILLTFFLIFETMELISYAFIDQFRNLWKIKDSSMDLIQLIFGVTRITPLMKYLRFDYYFILFIILIVFIFFNFLLLSMTIILNKTESKIYAITISFTSYITSSVCVFFLIPVSEVMLLIVKCENGQVVLVKDSINCFKGLHILYVMLAIFAMLLFLLLIILNAVFNFNPFNSNKPTTIINPAANTFLVIFKIVLVILYIVIVDEWISIVIMILGSFLNVKNAWENPTYNSYFLQCMVSIRNVSVFWTFVILFTAKLVEKTNFNGMIYLLAIGYPFVVLASILYYRYLRQQICEGKWNFKSVGEFLLRVNYLKVLINAFINKNINNRSGNNFNTLKKKEILLRGQIKIHEETCTNEECPLKKFLENQGNFQVQKTSLLHYMNIVFNDAIKKFPDSQIILMTFVQFNFEKKYNLNSARMYLSKLERFKNSIGQDYILFFIKKSVSNIGKRSGDDEILNEEDTPEQKFKRCKLLIDTSAKLFGEFWGILATNLTNNLNLNKLFFVGNKLNSYLRELNSIWEEYKTKRLDTEQQNVLQLYYLFTKDIMQNKVKAEEIGKKLNEESGYEVRHTESDKFDINNLDSILENQDYVFFCRSNDMGNCSIIQCSNSMVSLLGYQKQELVGKKIEMLMPMLAQIEHSKMLGSRLKSVRTSGSSGTRDLKLSDKKQIFLTLKNKVGYLCPVNAKFSVYNDDDFSNTFIIKVKLEPRDPKVLYAYYIMTKGDFTIDSFSSSAINLGLTMDLLKKHLINVNNLIRSAEDELISIFEHLQIWEEEPQTVLWVFPDLIYPKKEMANNSSAEIEMDKLIQESKKRKMIISVSPFRFFEGEPFGYCFKFIECENSNAGNSGNGLRNQEGFDANGFSVFSEKLMVYDILRLNYLRVEIVKEKKEKNALDEEKEHFENRTRKEMCLIEGDTIDKKNSKVAIGNIKGDEEENSVDDKEESEEDKNDFNNPLTAEKIRDFTLKGSDEIRLFIKELPFYGKEIFMKQKLPNKEENNVGYRIEPKINITLDDFKKRMDRMKLIDKRQIEKSTENEQKEQSITMNSPSDIESVSSSTATLNNIFSKNSISYIKIMSLSYFILLIILLSLEFSLSFNQVKTLKDRLFYSSLSYNVLADLMYTKFFLTEALESKEHSNRSEYYNELTRELSNYRQSISDKIALFNNATITFGKNYHDLVNNKQIDIITLSNMQQTTEKQPFWTGISRIPTSIFYVSTVATELINISMNDRNTFELMMNLLNDYFISWMRLTRIIADEVKSHSVMLSLITIIFIISFIITVIYSILGFKLLSKFLSDGTRPVDLVMTIKRMKFEELKITCETFLNRLVNRFIGGEEIDDENQVEVTYSVSSDDIVISKFKQKNNYNQVITSNKKYLVIYISLVAFFIFFQIYFIFKYLYEKNYLKHIYYFSTIHNITHFSESDLCKYINIAKSYFFNSSIPIFCINKTEVVFQNAILNLSDSLELMIKETYANMHYVDDDYINFFYQMLNEDITYINTGNFTEKDFDSTMIKGFKPLALHFLELVRYVGLNFPKEGDSSPWEQQLIEGGNILKDVIRPWYKAVREKLTEIFNGYVDDINLVLTTLFIVFLIVLLIVYALVWKNVENRLERYLLSSIDIINLIPEKLKFQMVIKLNEEEQRENKE